MLSFNLWNKHSKFLRITGINLIHNMESDKCRRIISNISTKHNNISHWIDFSFHVRLHASKEKLILYKWDYLGYLNKIVSLTILVIEKKFSFISVLRIWIPYMTPHLFKNMKYLSISRIMAIIKQLSEKICHEILATF
jgi:hypothetical protein